MRRSGHPSRPRAITCCFFSSLKTLLIPTKATALRRNQRPRASFSLAGFQVTLIGRFWVTAEAETVRGSVWVRPADESDRASAQIHVSDNSCDLDSGTALPQTGGPWALYETEVFVEQWKR